MKTLRPPLMLAPDNIPTEVVAALEVLLKDAKQGKLIGLRLQPYTPDRLVDSLPRP